MSKRADQISRLKSETFDLLVIGGGATGAGVALDAASRGLKVALVEKNDFASGTSSRSTKLIHGGVRYLEQAVKGFDKDQFYLVKDALHERKTLIKIAPHLAQALPIVTPLYQWFAAPYYMVGLKLYDFLAGKKSLQGSHYLSAKKARLEFPMLKKSGLKGGVLYYDGQFDDARMNVSIAMTARDLGAAVLNYCSVEELLKDGSNKLSGATLKDALSQEKFQITAKAIVNATGPFVDRIRQMDDPEQKPMLTVSSGVHIVLDKKFSPPATGLLIPKTEDGRVLFLLPWLDHTLVGTTDNPSEIQEDPKASEEDIEYILRHIQKYFEVPVQRSDVLSAWCGLRPLVSDPDAVDTAKLCRDHVLNVSASGLLTITGGKWTTYRKMALDTVDRVLEYLGRSDLPDSKTDDIYLRGGRGYQESQIDYLQDKYSIDLDIARHLCRAYGTLAEQVLLMGDGKYLKRLSVKHPFIEAEIFYLTQEEAACRAEDILARRFRLSFIDADSAKLILPRVIDLMGEAFEWDAEKKSNELDWVVHKLAS